MIKNHLPFLALIYLLLSGCTSKTVDVQSSSTQDSIQKYLDLAGNDTLEFDTRIKFNDKALSFIDLKKNDSLTRAFVYLVGINNFNFLQFEKLETNAYLLYDLSLKSKDSLRIACSNRLIGLYYMSKSENEKAIEFLYKARRGFKKTNATHRLISLEKDIASLQTYSSDFLGSNYTLFNNIDNIIRFDKNLNYEKFRNYSLIASNLFWLKDYRNSIVYEKIALDQIKGNLFYSNICFLNIAACYGELKEYNKATYFLNKILKNPNSKKINPNNFITAESYLGNIKLCQNKLDGLPKKFFEAESYFSKKETFNGRNFNYLFLSKYYEKINQPNQSILYAKKAVQTSRNYNNQQDLLICLNQLIKVDKKNASKNAEEYIKISDSMQIAERKFREKFAQIQFETQEITAQKNTAIRQRSIILAIALALLSIIILLYVIFRQQIKQNELKLIQTQQKANEKIYQLMLSHTNNEERIRESEKKRIALELHDGVMNKLASIRLNLSIIKRKKDESTIDKCIEYVNDIYKVETEIRTITHNLSDNNTQKAYDFEKMLKDLIRQQNEVSQAKYQLEIDKAINWDLLSDAKKMNLYRIIQEAAQNINKHSKASLAIISFLIDEGSVCLLITDNGIGIKTTNPDKGIGLKNIEYRVTQLSGKFTINSKKNQNTSLNISFPLN